MEKKEFFGGKDQPTPQSSTDESFFLILMKNCTLIEYCLLKKMLVICYLTGKMQFVIFTLSTWPYLWIFPQKDIE